MRQYDRHEVTLASFTSQSKIYINNVIRKSGRGHVPSISHMYKDTAIVYLLHNVECNLQLIRSTLQEAMKNQSLYLCLGAKILKDQNKKR